MTQLQHELMQKLYGHDVWECYDLRHVEDVVQGWNSRHPSLANLVSTPEPKVVLDVGVWKGGSTIHMARALAANGINGVIIAIDTFLGSSEHWTGKLALFDRDHGYPSLYWTFLSNVVKAGVSDHVIPMPQTATTAAAILKRMGIKAHLIHIDASHDYRDVLRDAEDYWELLEPGGYLIGDDYHQTWPGVIRAAGEFSARVCRPLAIQPPKWILNK